MRTFKRIITFILATTLIAALFFCAFTVKGYDYIYGVSLDVLIEKFINDDDYKEFSPIKSTLNRSMVFTLSCTPETMTEFDFIQNFLTYIDSETGVKYICDNIGYAAGQLVNEYLKTGDGGLLDSLFGTAKDKALYSDLRRGWYEQLYKYNSEKIGNTALSFFGLTAEQEGGAHTILYINQLIKRSSGVYSSAKITSAINGNKSDPNAYLTTLKKSVDEYESLYKELFTSDYFNFKCALDNYFYDIGDYIQSEKAKAVNFTRIYDKNIRGKYFVILPDATFMDSVYVMNDEIEKRTASFNLYDRDWFGETGSIYSIRGGILKYFQKYGRMVSRINGRGEGMEEIGESVYFIYDRS